MNNSELTRQRAIDSRPSSGEVGEGHLPLNRGIFLIVWRGRWIILASTILGIVGGFYYLSKQIPIYSSSSRVLVEAESIRLIGADGLSSSRTGNYLQTQCQLIKSSQILSSVSELPDLRAMRTFDGIDNPIGLLKGSLSAEVGQKDDVITVAFESPYPAEAASVVNAVVDSYKSYCASRKRSTAGEVLRVLTKEKKDRETELAEKTRTMLAYKKENPSLSVAGEKGNYIIDQLGKLSDALGQAHLEVVDAKGVLDGATATAADPNRLEQWLRFQENSAGGNPLYGEVQRLDLELLKLKDAVGMNHATYRATQTMLNNVRAKIQEQAKSAFDAYLATVAQRWQNAKQRESQLQESFDIQQKSAIALNSQSAQYAAMESDAKRLEKLCDLLDDRIKEVNLSGNAEPMNFTVLEIARAGGPPVRPRRSVILFEALMLGLLAGGGIAYLRELMDQRLSSVEEIQARLRLNVLGVLPHMNGRETAAVRGQKVQLDPMSDIAEAYRTVRTAIYFGAPEGKTKTILITSPAPGDGKTTSASNLAIAMAQAGQRVLLIDCDFRRPMQHRIFGIEDGMGVTSVLTGKDLLSKAVKMTPTKGLYLLPSGPIPRNPSEILNSQKFAQLLSRVQEKFDHVILDSPPVMPVTDARILGASCDLTIIVLRAQKSTRKISEQACSSLVSVGSKILGAIVNDAPRSRSGYGYSYGYYRYGYGARNSANGKAMDVRKDESQLPVRVGADPDGERDGD